MERCCSVDTNCGKAAVAIELFPLLRRAKRETPPWRAINVIRTSDLRTIGEPISMDSNEVDWSTDAIIGRRDKFFAASQRAFVPYRTPLIFSRGERQYLWDEKGKKYID